MQIYPVKIRVLYKYSIDKFEKKDFLKKKLLKNNYQKKEYGINYQFYIKI